MKGRDLVDGFPPGKIVHVAARSRNRIGRPRPGNRLPGGGRKAVADLALQLNPRRPTPQRPQSRFLRTDRRAVHVRRPEREDPAEARRPAGRRGDWLDPVSVCLTIPGRGGGREQATKEEPEGAGEIAASEIVVEATGRPGGIGRATRPPAGKGSRPKAYSTRNGNTISWLPLRCRQANTGAK